MKLRSTFVLLIVMIQVVLSEIIPSDNRIIWEPGIRGGKSTPDIEVNAVTDFNADKSGASDSKEAIQNAINSLKTSGGVVYIPEGDYLINGSLAIKYNNIVLRGDGATKTKLRFENPDLGGCIEVITYGRGEWQGVSGYTKDAKTVTVNDGSKFTIGEFAEIQQENDSDFMYTDPEWNQSYAQDVVGQFMEVVSINGNEITFASPLHLTYQAKFNPEIRPQRLINGVGIENLYMWMPTDSDVHGIHMKNAAYCWVDSIEGYYSAKAHVYGTSAFGCEVTNSKFSRSHNYGGGGHGYGVSLGFHTTDWLVENNAFDSLRHAMIFSKGANGNVIAYNYSQNVLQGEGETDLNVGWIPPDISNHGHFAYMNLIEGNSVQEVGISDHWGPSGPGNVYFRNRVLHGETQDGISYYDVSVKQNLLGNSCIKIRDADGGAADNLEHGNVVNGVEIWDENIGDRELPKSYYLTAKPAFFGNINWPLYGPEEGFTEKLPAQLAFEGIEVPTVLHKQKAAVTNSLSVYANRSKQIAIQFVSASEKSHLVMYDVKGRVVYSKTVAQSGKHSVNIDGKKFASGIYLVNVISHEANLSKKFVLSK